MKKNTLLLLSCFIVSSINNPFKHTYNKHINGASNYALKNDSQKTSNIKFSISTKTNDTTNLNYTFNILYYTKDENGSVKQVIKNNLSIRNITYLITDNIYFSSDNNYEIKIQEVGYSWAYWKIIPDGGNYHSEFDNGKIQSINLNLDWKFEDKDLVPTKGTTKGAHVFSTENIYLNDGTSQYYHDFWTLTYEYMVPTWPKWIPIGPAQPKSNPDNVYMDIIYVETGILALTLLWVVSTIILGGIGLGFMVASKYNLFERATNSLGSMFTDLFSGSVNDIKNFGTSEVKPSLMN